VTPISLSSNEGLKRACIQPLAEKRTSRIAELF
jgi:hypothetical protein